MIPRQYRILALLVAASLASRGEARAACTAARPASSPALGRAWHDALEALSASTSLPGRPWSCVGGTVALDPAGAGARLTVAPIGGPSVVRAVTSADDVVPLGQALLALPLPAPPPVTEPEPTPPDTTTSAPAFEVAPLPPRDVPSPKPASPRTERVLLAAGIDGHFAGGSNMAWVGPVVSASVPIGSWLPSLAFRQQSAVGERSGALDELAVALAVQRRVPIRALELRVGGVLRGAAVLRDLSRRQGDQSELEGRVGAIVSLVVPVVRWGSLALSVDGDVVALSRRTADLTTTTGLAPFPSYTLGGGLAFQVAP